VLLPLELKQLGLDVIKSAGFCLNLFLAKGAGYFAPEASSQPVLHLWSLGVEEQFYLLWPLLIWMTVAVRVNFLPMVVFFTTSSLAWAMNRIPGAEQAAFFLPPNRFWELGLGALAALANSIFRDRPLFGNLMALAGMSLVVAGIFCVREEPGFPNAWALLPTAGAALVVCSPTSAWFNRRVLSMRVIVGLGLISYPLYLWHWPLLTFARLGLDQGSSVRVTLAALGVAVGLAWLTYILVESPIRRRVASAARIMTLAGAMTVLIAVGLWFEHEKGFPRRFPIALQQLAQFTYDHSTPWREDTYFLTNRSLQKGFPDDPHEIDPRKPTLVLWGDSHAASLYPGLKTHFGERFNVVQRTLAATTPIIEPNAEPNATKATLNASILETIQRIHPRDVVLAGNWPLYGWKGLEETVNALKRTGVPNIVLVGPVPQWIGSLPQQICNYVRRHPAEPIPQRLSSGYKPEVLQIDRDMHAFAAKEGIKYVSPCEIFHSPEGYLVRTGPLPDSIVAWDYGHLTVAGSEYLVERFRDL
jgi:hypothetical protein